MNTTFNNGDMITYVLLERHPNMDGYLIGPMKQSMIVCPAPNDDEYLLDNGFILTAPKLVKDTAGDKAICLIGLMRLWKREESVPDYGCDKGFARYLVAVD